MIYLELLWTFFKIGLFTFGGGYAMIPMIKSEVVTKGWIAESQLVDFIGISESTPGPFAINMATFVGTKMGGFGGALIATLGVVLPSFIIILLIAMVFRTFTKNRYVKAALNGIKPVVVALIAGTAILLCLSALNIDVPHIDKSAFSLTALTLMVLLISLQIGYKIVRKRSLSPIFLILIAAALGILVF